MQFDLRAFLEGARKPYEAHFQADLTQSDFGGYTLASRLNVTLPQRPPMMARRCYCV